MVSDFVSSKYNIISFVSTGLKGLFYDFLITFLAILFPLFVGIVFTVLMHFTRKTAVPKIFRYLSIFTEGLMPTAILLFSYYCIFVYGSNIIPAVMTLSLCFMGYMVFRYDERDSIWKNILVNSLGLIADMLKWCFGILGYVAINDFTRAMNMYRNMTFNAFLPLSILIIVTFIILAPIYIVSQVLKDVMK